MLSQSPEKVMPGARPSTRNVSFSPVSVRVALTTSRSARAAPVAKVLRPSTTKPSSAGVSERAASSGLLTPAQKRLSPGSNGLSNSPVRQICR